MVMAYHGVGEVADGEDPKRLVLAPDLFEDQLRLLVRRGYRFLTAESLLAEAPDGRPSTRTAVLTFDDGWLDGATIVVPVLRRLGVTATFDAFLRGSAANTPG